METPAPLLPPDVAVTPAQFREVPARRGYYLDGPAEGREWALVRLRDPGTWRDGRTAWADLPAGVPRAQRIAEVDHRTADGYRPGDLRYHSASEALVLVGGPSAGLLGARLLTELETDAAERAFGWGVLLASDAALADIAAEEALQVEVRAAMRAVCGVG